MFFIRIYKAVEALTKMVKYLESQLDEKGREIEELQEKVGMMSVKLEFEVGDKVHLKKSFCYDTCTAIYSEGSYEILKAEVVVRNTSYSHYAKPRYYAEYTVFNGFRLTKCINNQLKLKTNK